MRLRKLSLERFGHFTDHEFDFGESRDTSDFHIIYGANEAGKTTTMEATLRLFYGFPARESYDFKHQRKNLQVSGLLEIDGQLNQFTRLTKRTASLLDASGTALPETSLATHLAGLSQDDYRKLLCLDDETIEKGGEEIAQAEGDIGRLLFSAAAGVENLSMVLDEVSDAKDQIWRKRASKTRIAELKRELSDVDAQLKEQDISASKWRSLKKQYTAAQSSETGVRKTQQDHLESASLIDAKRRALPKLKEIEDNISRNATYAGYPEQLDFDPEELITIQSNVKVIQADLQRLETELHASETKLSNVIRTPELASLPEKLNELDNLKARDLTARQDIERRRKELLSHYNEMENAARNLGLRDLTDLKPLVLTLSEIQRLAALRETLLTANRLFDAEKNEVTELEERHEKAKKNAKEAASNAPKNKGISHILDRHDANHLAPAYFKIQQQIDLAKLNAAQAVDALTVGSTRFDTIPSVMHSTIKAQSLLDEHSLICQQITQIKSELATHQETASALRAEIKTLASEGSLIPDHVASTLREERNQLWQTHKSALSIDTANMFERAMIELDATADSRLVNAREIGQLRQIDQSLAAAQGRAEQTEARLLTLNNDKEAIEREVDNAASAAGLPAAQIPAEWLDWMQRHDQACNTTRELSTLQQNHRADIERAEILHTDLRKHLDLENPSFDTAITHARDQATAELDTLNASNAAVNSLKEIAENLESRQEKLNKAQNEKHAAEDKWRSSLLDYFGTTDIQESLLGSLDPLRNLREQSDNHARTAQRINAMEADQQQFHDEVSRLCNAHSLAIEGNASDTYELLRKQSADAQASELEFANLTKAIEKAKSDKTIKTKELEDINHRVISIGSIFPSTVTVNSLDELRKAATEANRLNLERTRRTALELEVLTDLGAESINHARELLHGATDAKLHAEAESIKTQLTEIEKQLTQTIETRIAAGNTLDDVTGDSELSALTERKTTIEIQLEDAAMEYLELSLGHNLAEQAIHRYRDTHRSGMMAATEKCFATLTQGKYPKLKVEPNARKETLLAVDKTGATKRAAEMSKGTRFQLYLALRAAAHEQMVNQGTVLPFFCDDIFETFDEERTSAACRVMEQIGLRGQAIYLTHHRHVVEIAQKVCTVAPTIHEII